MPALRKSPRAPHKARAPWATKGSLLALTTRVRAGHRRDDLRDKISLSRSAGGNLNRKTEPSLAPPCAPKRAFGEALPRDYNRKERPFNFFSRRAPLVIAPRRPT